MNGKHQVWDQVEIFRENHHCEEIATLPIDALGLAEIELRLDLIPFDDLYTKYGVDAAVTADFSGLYVDAETFHNAHKLPKWKENRMRFTIAHEIGHIELHQSEFEAHGFKKTDEFIAWSRSLGGKKFEIEQQANEFAGRLLVPREALESELKKLEDAFRGFPRWRENAETRVQAAELLGQKFGISTTGMATRFSREELWPEPVA